jgi:hypothetical protein
MTETQLTLLDNELLESVHGLDFEGDEPSKKNEIPFYDDGFGPLWILQDTTGIVGIVRATTFEEAYEMAEDELYPEADVASWEAEAKSDGFDDIDKYMESAIFQENYGFRPNGCNMKDVHKHGIYQKDLNGERFRPLTSEMVEKYHLLIKKSSYVS